MEEQWIEDIRTKMRRLEKSAPQPDWNALDKALAQRRLAAATPSAAAVAPRSVAMRRWTAAAAVALLLIGSGAMMFDRSADTAPREAETVLASEGNDIQEVVRTAATAERHLAAAAAPAHGRGAGVAAAPLLAAAAAETAAAERQEEGHHAAGQQEGASDDSRAGSDAPRHETAAADGTPRTEKGAKRRLKTSLYEPLAPERKASKPRLAASLYAANTLGGHGGQQMSGVYLASARVIGNAFSEMNDPQSGYEMDGSPETTTDVRHHLPVRVGLGVAYRLTDRLAVEAGLQYTRLRTDVDQAGVVSTAQSKLTLDYLGIPLAASYSLWDNSSLRVYVKGGVTLEKMVRGRSETDSYTGDKHHYHDTRKLTESGLQVSVNGAAGVEWQILKPVALYAEPTVNYYFGRDNAIPSVYQDRQLNFSVGLGLRFNINK